jgi:hypothetical protein
MTNDRSEFESGIVNSLNGIDWFRNAGKTLDDKQLHIVASLSEAMQFIRHDVSEWAVIEARTILFEKVRDTDRAKFRIWNDIAAQASLKAGKLADQAVIANRIHCNEEHLHEWLQAIIGGAAMEEYFESCAAVSIFRRLTDILLLGHLPCGWYLRSADDFPIKCDVIVY